MPAGRAALRPPLRPACRSQRVAQMLPAACCLPGDTLRAKDGRFLVLGLNDCRRPLPPQERLRHIGAQRATAQGYIDRFQGGGKWPTCTRAARYREALRKADAHSRRPPSSETGSGPPERSLVGRSSPLPAFARRRSRCRRSLTMKPRRWPMGPSGVGLERLPRVPRCIHQQQLLRAGRNGQYRHRIP